MSYFVFFCWSFTWKRSGSITLVGEEKANLSDIVSL